jgi:hypothetical protein
VALIIETLRDYRVRLELTHTEIRALLDRYAQNCAICGAAFRRPKIARDEANAVRGLLCARCGTLAWRYQRWQEGMDELACVRADEVRRYPQPDLPFAGAPN